MKAVITKSQFNRIKNFINETKEIPKTKVLKETETKQGSEDFPFEIAYNFISLNGGKDFLMRKGISNWRLLKRAILNNTITRSEISKFRNVDGKSFLDTYYGQSLSLNEKKKPTKKQLDTFDIDNDGDIEADDMADLRAMRKISEKKSFPDLTGDGKVTKADILKGRGVELDEKKYSDKASSFIGKEISHLMHDKNYPHDRAVAAAINVAKEKGMKVGKKQMDEDEDCGCGGSGEDTRYMFFSNLEQMMRQARMLLQMDEDMLEDLLNNGHDWAADHITEAKNNMDQVFDFIMGEMNGEGEDDSFDGQEKEMVYEGMSLKKKVKVSKELKNHLDKNISLYESEFRSGSEKHINLLKEVKELYSKGLINLNETDEFIVNEFNPTPVKIKGIGEVYLGLIQEEYESDEQLLSEAVYQGRKVELGKAFLTPDGPKKRSVYVRNDKGNVVKVNFGDPNMRIKKNIPARRKSFRARHKCSNPGPRWKSRYWSCRFW